MKYMGSKRAMLRNGLGTLLQREAANARRFVDLFSGSASVSIHVAQRHAIPVTAYDLQSYSVIIAEAVIGRDRALPWSQEWKAWRKRASKLASKFDIPSVTNITKQKVEALRRCCSAQVDLPIVKAYGGHYFSPHQAACIDALRATLPEEQPARIVALSALIQAASQSAAAPGHTAQPFQPTPTAKRFLVDAWSRDIMDKTKNAFKSIAGEFAKVRGTAEVGNANDVADSLEEGDLVFIDPPYSGVHYSRFYHVLETIAAGSCGEVSGIGRYPAQTKRPQSKYSMGAESATALDDLLQKVAAKRARAILTFPDHECSNGMSGDSVRRTSEKYFRITEEYVKSQFSTLGGVGGTTHVKKQAAREARHERKELMLVLAPR